MSETSTEVNIPLLRKAVEWAEAEAAKPRELCEWYQRAYSVDPNCKSVQFFAEGFETYQKSSDCGTCYCIAGYVSQVVAGVDNLDIWNSCVTSELDEDGNPMSMEEFAEKELGLTEEQGIGLFDGYNSIEDVRRIAEKIAGESL